MIQLVKQLGEEKIGTSTVKELWMGEDGQEYEKLIQQIDKKAE